MECEDWQSRRSLVSSLKILLTLESAGLVLTLTAGASIIAQLGEFSQCILFTYKGDRRSSGPLSLVEDCRGSSLIGPNGGILCSKAPSRGLWMPELVLYGIRLLA